MMEAHALIDDLGVQSTNARELFIAHRITTYNYRGNTPASIPVPTSHRGQLSFSRSGPWTCTQSVSGSSEELSKLRVQ